MAEAAFSLEGVGLVIEVEADQDMDAYYEDLPPEDSEERPGG